MAHAYTPGLKVLRRARIRKRRILPIQGEVLVEEGARVAADDVVARAYLPGPVLPINVAQKLGGLPPEDVPAAMLVAEGDAVREGQAIARTKGFLGLFKSEVRAHAEGTIETISPRTGQIMLRGAAVPLQLRAYVPGRVARVLGGEGVEIETVGSLIQGIFGIGGERSGTIQVRADGPASLLDRDAITEGARGAVVVGGRRATRAAFDRAREVGAAAIVAGGFDDGDLRAILGHEIGVAITGEEPVETTLIVTEGFGDMAMARATFDLLRELEGREASLSGATQIRAGVIRPEIIAAAEAGEEEAAVQAAGDGRMEVGSTVRIIREPHFGELARVAELPPEPMRIETGAIVRVLVVERPTGERHTLPRANVELVER